MGHRRKCLYRGGQLLDACTGELLHHSYIRSETIEPAEYRVTLDTPRGLVRIWEDEQALWLDTDGQRRAISRSPVKLPRFEPHAQAPLLRALHAQLLINIMPFGPVPNLWVYPRPWYRDSAMVDDVPGENRQPRPGRALGNGSLQGLRSEQRRRM